MEGRGGKPWLTLLVQGLAKSAPLLPSSFGINKHSIYGESNDIGATSLYVYMCIDMTVKELLNGMLESEDSWLIDSLDRVLRVTASRPHSPYGFEWLVHTAFAVHLLKRGGPTVTDIRIGLKEESSSKKPDVRNQII